MSFNDLVDIIVKTDNDNAFEENNSLQLIELLKQNLMKKSPGIPFSGKFEFVKTFGKELQPVDNNAENLVGLRNPYDLKIDNKLQLVFVVDFFNSRIVVFNLDGNYLYHFQTLELLVSDTHNNRIQVFNCNGQFIKNINAPFDKNWGIAVDKTNDNILTVDIAGQDIHILSEDGILIKSIKQKELQNPMGIDYCSFNGYVYVCGDRSNNVVIFK